MDNIALSSESQLHVSMNSLQLEQPEPCGSLPTPDVYLEPESLASKSAMVLRKRPGVISNILPKRRVLTHPQKRPAHLETEKQLRVYYLNSNKNLKTSSSNLETIVEEPHDKLNELLLISGRKFKRYLNFTITKGSTKDKIKKRKAKIRKFFNGKFKHLKKISDEQFAVQLSELEERVSESMAIGEKTTV